MAILQLVQGASKKLLIDFSAFNELALVDLEQIRIALVEQRTDKLVAEGRYPAESGYLNLEIVSEVDKTMFWMIEPSISLLAKRGVYQLEIYIRDEDVDFKDGFYRTIGVAENFMEITAGRIGDD